MIHRQQPVDRLDRRGIAAQIDLRLIAEHVIGELVDAGQLRPVDRLQRGEVGFEVALVARGRGIADVIAEAIRIAQVAAEDRTDRVQRQIAFVAVVKQALELHILRAIAGQRGGRRQCLAEGRRGDGGEQQGRSKKTHL